MVNLIFFLPSFSFYGAGRSTYKLCKNLSNKKYNISIISLGKNSYKKELVALGFKIYEVNTKRIFFSFFKINKLVKNIISDKYKKNIFISAHHYANVFSILALRNIKNLKVLCIERSDLSELKLYNNLFSYLKNLLIYFLVKFLYKKADLIISNSKSGKKDIDKICKVKSAAIHSPSFTFYKKNIKPKKINSLKILTVGRLVGIKGIETMIKAIKCLKIKNFTFTIIGDGPDKKKLKNMIKNDDLKNKVFLLGYKKDIKKYYLSSNLFINASNFEGFPNAIVESINYGTPVICSSCKGGTREIILNGKGGDLFKVGDYHELATKIFSFYNNPKKLNEKLLLARKYIHKYSVKSHVSKYENIFIRL